MTDRVTETFEYAIRYEDGQGLIGAALDAINPRHEWPHASSADRAAVYALCAIAASLQDLLEAYQADAEGKS